MRIKLDQWGHHHIQSTEALTTRPSWEPAAPSWPRLRAWAFQPWTCVRVPTERPTLHKHLPQPSCTSGWFGLLCKSLHFYPLQTPGPSAGGWTVSLSSAKHLNWES